jgi:hypothetical protein
MKLLHILDLLRTFPYKTDLHKLSILQTRMEWLNMATPYEKLAPWRGGPTYEQSTSNLPP